MQQRNLMIAKSWNLETAKSPHRKTAKSQTWEFVKLWKPEFKFNENPIEIYIPANDTRTFIFEGEVIGEDGGGIAAGKYVMSWKTYKDGVKFNSGDIDAAALLPTG